MPGAAPEAVARVREMAGAYRVSQLVYLAARLDLADRLADGPRSATELAARTGTQVEPLQRVLRGMVGLELIAELPDGRFGSTPLLAALRSDDPSAARSSVLFTAAEQNTRAWAALEHTLRTGRSGFEHAFGTPRFDYIQAHPEWASVFQSQMSVQMDQVARAVVAAYDFGGVANIADIGGGRGTLLAHVLRAYPEMRGILFDLPEICTAAEAVLRQAGVLERCRLQPGDFFASIPDGAELYVLSWIVHDWPDAQAAQILETCARHVQRGTRLLVIERVLPDASADARASRDALLGDVHMLAVLTGRERTRSELQQLLAAADFRLERVVPTASARMILETVRT